MNKIKFWKNFSIKVIAIIFATILIVSFIGSLSILANPPINEVNVTSAMDSMKGNISTVDAMTQQGIMSGILSGSSTIRIALQSVVIIIALFGLITISVKSYKKFFKEIKE